MQELHHSLPSQLTSIAACHKLCFPNSLSGKLGKSYQIKSMEWFLAGENRFLFHISNNDTVTGYCGGFISAFSGDGSTSGIMQYAMAQAVKGMLKKPWLLFNSEVMAMYPLIIRNVSRKIFGSKKKVLVSSTANSVFERRVGLVVIGVHPTYRGKGVFEMLMGEFEKQTRQRGIYKMTLSVKKTNTHAVKAYQKVGWKVFKEHEHSLEMMKMLTG